MRAAACIAACAPLTASVVSLRRWLGSYHSQLLRGRRRKPMNGTDGATTATQLSKSREFLPCFGSIVSFSWGLADRADGGIGLATAMIVFLGATAGAMLCFGL